MEENDPRKLKEQYDRLTTSIERYESDSKICNDVIKSMSEEEGSSSFMNDMQDFL